MRRNATERLEGRSMLAADVSVPALNLASVAIDQGILQIRGTTRSESITLSGVAQAGVGQAFIKTVANPGESLSAKAGDLKLVLRASPPLVESLTFPIGTDADAVDLAMRQVSGGFDLNLVLVYTLRRGKSDRIFVRQELLSEVIVDAGAGNDVLSVNGPFAGGTPIAVTLLGGKGNDWLIAGTDAVLVGGAGDDLLSGPGTLLGGAGNDTFFSSTHSVIDGGTGTDVADADSTNVLNVESFRVAR
jgi:hypothetical protein